MFILLILRLLVLIINDWFLKAGFYFMCWNILSIGESIPVFISSVEHLCQGLLPGIKIGSIRKAGIILLCF